MHATSRMALTLVFVITMVTASQSASAARLPLYYGFFANTSEVSQGLKQLARDTLAEALGIDEVRRLYCQYTNHSLNTSIAILTRFANTNPTDDLHVTSFYCNYGKVPACAAYAARSDVQAAIGRAFSVNVTAFLLTPRTIGYRVELGADALAIWANGDGEKVPGQRAHFTIATSPGVGAVQTGLDLLNVTNRPGRPIGARVLDFGQAQFLVLLHRPVSVTFLPSNGAVPAAAAPWAWLPLLAASAWRLFAQRLVALLPW